MHVQPSFPEFLPEVTWTPPDNFPEIGTAKWWSIDIESRDPHLKERGPGFVRGDASVIGVAVAVDGWSGYYPVRHVSGNLAPNLVFGWLRNQVKTFCGELFGANLLYDEEGLWYEGVKFRDDVIRRDIQIIEPLLDEETALGYSLEVLSRKYVGEGKREDLLRAAAAHFSKGFRDRGCRRPIPLDPKSDMWMIPPEYVGAYAQGDVELPRMVFEKQKKQIDDDNLWEILGLETSLIPILLRMRINGVAVDLEQAQRLDKLLTVEIDKYSLGIKEYAGFDPNVDSGLDLTKAYNNLNFKMPELGIAERLKYTAKGNPSFVSTWYESQSDPLSKLILKKKKLMTLRDDFVRGDIVKENVNGRIHSQFHQLRQDDRGTRSGRFSSTNINLQQIPARHDDNLWGPESPVWAEEVRKLFVPDKGKLWLKADYSQQEPRLTIHFAAKCGLQGAEEAVEAFRKNPRTDYHMLTTALVNEKSGRNYKRKQIKGINLGLVYGMGLQKLCRQLGLPENEGKEIIEAYHNALPFVKSLMTMATNLANNRGYIRTILLRLRRFNLWEPIPENREDRKFKVLGLPRDQAELKWPGRRLQRSGTHKALNSLIQGSAADQTKKAMQMLYYEHDIIPQLLVHDEIDGSVSGLDEARIIKQVMETAVTLVIPVVADATIGNSWGNAKAEV